MDGWMDGWMDGCECKLNANVFVVDWNGTMYRVMLVLSVYVVVNVCVWWRWLCW